jgi:malonyl-CoA O-methyltransferase
MDKLATLEKRRVRDSFDRAAECYDDVAVLQREVGQRIIERLDVIKFSPATILDVGSGTGVFAGALAKRYKKTHVIALDLSPRMLVTARKRRSLLQRGWLNRQDFVCGDAEQLPIADHSIDLLFSNLAIQWCVDLDKTFGEFKRVLKPGGLLMFSTLGPDTLKELRESWRAVDDDVHVHEFIDMHDVGDALLRAGLADPVMDVERFTLTYTDAFQLMRELKILGAHNAATERHHGLTGKARLQKMAQAYEDYRRDGLLPASYEVVYGHAWAAVEKAVTIPIESLLTRKHL